MAKFAKFLSAESKKKWVELCRRIAAKEPSESGCETAGETQEEKSEDNKDDQLQAMS